MPLSLAWRWSAARDFGGFAIAWKYARRTSLAGRLVGERLVIRVLSPEPTALEDYFLAVDVVAESETAEGEAPLTLADRDGDKLLDVVGAAPETTAQSVGLRGA